MRGNYGIELFSEMLVSLFTFDILDNLDNIFLNSRELYRNAFWVLVMIRKNDLIVRNKETSSSRFYSNSEANVSEL